MLLKAYRMDQEEVFPAVYSVSELTREIKGLLEDHLPPVWLQGELSNFIRHSSGHMYFSLKDQDAQIAGVMWRQRNLLLTFTPRDGMQVRVFGQVRVYEKRGTYQLDVLKMAPAGVGALQAAFEKLKAQLHAEGLLDADRKRPLPLFPTAVGIVTSATGAALRDIVQIIRRRAPGLQMILRPTLVQGEEAAEDIVQAIREFNEFNHVDVLIVGRGGGSLEDLWPFNEEKVARAISASKIPVVSAVGHEIDFTIADFVADLRAATPSAAAELVAPLYSALRQSMRELSGRCRRAFERALYQHRDRLMRLRSHYGLRRPADLLYQRRQRVDELLQSIRTNCRNRLVQDRQRLAYDRQLLTSLGPESVLRRGYALCWDEQTRRLVTRVEAITPGERLTVQLYDGQWKGSVDNISSKKWDEGGLEKK